MTGTSATWDGRYAYIFGGLAALGTASLGKVTAADVSQNRILRFDPVDGSINVMRAMLPTATSSTSAVWDGAHKSYVFGGADTGDIIRYDDTADQTKYVGSLSTAENPTWPFSTAIWDPRPGAGDCASGCAYVFGGSVGASDRIVRFDPLRPLRDLRQHLVDKISNASAVSTGAQGLIFGGVNAGRAIEQFDVLAGDQITKLRQQLPRPVADTSAVWVPAEDTAYIFGGDGDSARKIVRFHRDQPPLEMTTLLPEGATATSAVWDETKGVAHIFGGSKATAPERALRAVTSFTPSTKSATTPSMCRHQYAIVASTAADSVRFNDLQFGLDVPGALPVGRAPSAIVSDPATRWSYVANAGDGTVSVVDEQARTVLGTVTVGKTPTGLAFDQKAKRLFVATGDGVVSVDGCHTAGTGIACTVSAAPAIENTAGIASMADAQDLSGDRTFVANPSSGTVTVIDDSIGAVRAVVNVGARPGAVTVDPDAKRVYVAVAGKGEIAVIDAATDSVMQPITVGREPAALALDAGAHRLFVALAGDNQIAVVNTTTGAVEKRIPVGTKPRGIAVDPIQRRVVVANEGSGNVSVLNEDTGARVDMCVNACGGHPVAVTIDPNGHAAYVLDQAKQNVSGIDLLSGRALFASPVTVGASPGAIAFDTTTSRIYVANADSNTLSAIETRAARPHVVAEFGLGSGMGPSGISIIAGTFASVANSRSNSVTFAGLESIPPRSAFAQGASVLVDTGAGFSPVAGTATDTGAGIRQVRVTYTSVVPDTQFTPNKPVTVIASLACSDSTRRSCTFFAPPPPAPGVYIAQATAKDRAGNIEPKGPTATIVAG